MAEIKSLEDIERLAETNSWWAEILQEVHKAINLYEYKDIVTDEHKAEAVHALFERYLISEDDLNKAQDDPVFVEALSIIKGLSVGETYPERLNKLYQSRLSYAQSRIKNLVLALIPLIADEDRRKEVEAFWSEKCSKPLSFNRLTNGFSVRDLSQRFIIGAIADLSETYLGIQHSEQPFDTSEHAQIEMEGSQRERAEYLAYKIFDPSWHVSKRNYEPEYLSFPLKWSGFLSVSKMDELYERHKAGKDVIADLVSFLHHSDELDKLEVSIAGCPVTSEHAKFFNEVVSSFKDSKYLLCSKAALTIIEGLIWSFAWWWNKSYGPIFDRAITIQSYKTGNFELLTVKGNKLLRPTVADLLRNSEFGKEFGFNFMEYYCQELYPERNPVLHGREPSYGGEKKAAVLLFVVRAIERQITQAIKNNVRDSVTSSLEEAEKKAASA